jgi:undecaprenyl phosphate-alpha-L-ara4FN deformylase
VDATFYFSVGPDHTGRAMRRVFRKGFAQKVARTSVLKHYGLKTLMYGVLLPGPDIGRAGAARRCAGCATPGFEVGLHTYDHVRWQDSWRSADAQWTRVEIERGLRRVRARVRIPAGIACGRRLADQRPRAWSSSANTDSRYASDTRGGGAFLPLLNGGVEHVSADTHHAADLR